MAQYPQPVYAQPQQSAPQYYAQAPPPQQNAFDNFRPVMARYEIGDFFASKIRQLEGYEIVLICDDSGSMNTPVTSPGSDPYAPRKTRWDELKEMSHVIVEVAACLDPDGIDVYFLNRGKIANCRNVQAVDDAFRSPAAGFTPTSRIVRQVFADKKAIVAEKKMLIVIATDGEPTNDSGSVDINTLRHILVNERDANKIYVTFVACTADDDNAIGYLNEWDRNIRNLDVVDDYQSERREILRAQGQNFRFTYGDYVVKALLGAVDPSMDRLDEGHAGGQQPNSQAACCTIL